MGGEPQCRIWWPSHFTISGWPLPDSTSMLLLGWPTHSPPCLDLVVAAAFPCPSSTLPASYAQDILSYTSKCLPHELQRLTTLSFIGHCVISVGNHMESSNKKRGSCMQNKEEASRVAGSSKFAQVEMLNCNGDRRDCFSPQGKDRWKPRRKKSGYLMPPNGYRIEASAGNVNHLIGTLDSEIWAELELMPQNGLGRSTGLKWIPKLLTLRTQGTLHLPDVHLVIYEQPRLGSHHFSSFPWSATCMENQDHAQSGLNRMKDSVRCSEWVAEMENQLEAPDIDSLVLQLNCAASVENAVKDLISSVDASCKRLFLCSILCCSCRHIVAATVALLATFLYILVQAGSFFAKLRPFSLLNALCAKIMTQTWRAIGIRCRELTGWPVILLWKGCGRYQPNVAAAHKAALIKHSAWSAIVFDMLFGILVGALLLSFHTPIYHWVRALVRSLTDDILRTGCIWLMGVPAGFKLNTELAGTFGLLSLNVIQAWSTLLYLLKPIFGPLLRVLAITGMLFGITVPAAMVADMLFLATIHITVLHQMIAFLYSNQLQALAALWRLFRGRKRNSLRGRIDTYDHTVEQHVVGSLMFTPLLLLLPTTSVFYIFFTILFTSLSVLQFGLKIFVAFLHCFPYAQAATWFLQPRRFSSGIWFETFDLEVAEESSSYREEPGLTSDSSSAGSCGYSRSGNLVSLLGSRIASFGDISSPYLRQLAGDISWSSCGMFAYRIFSGERWLCSLELGTPTLPPWLSVSAGKFWLLCYDAVLSSM